MMQADGQNIIQHVRNSLSSLPIPAPEVSVETSGAGIGQKKILCTTHFRILNECQGRESGFVCLVGSLNC